jgi:NAD+ synthase
MSKTAINPKDLAKNISDWILEYSETNGISRLIIGISGGIDSALVSTLCAMTGLETFIVSLPIHQNTKQLGRARNHSLWLSERYDNVKVLELDLSQIFDAFEKAFESEEHCPLSLANSRSRLRMTALYQIAGSKKGIVVGTGNKVEDFGVGFFTKYGDGGVDISPIADLMKSQVRTLASGIGIMEEIVNAEPTDGLWGDDRTDEQQIGASYDELEWAMEFKGDIGNLSGRNKEVYKIYNKFNTANKHKMSEIPIFKINEL